MSKTILSLCKSDYELDSTDIQNFHTTWAHRHIKHILWVCKEEKDVYEIRKLQNKLTYIYLMNKSVKVLLRFRHGKFPGLSQYQD